MEATSPYRDKRVRSLLLSKTFPQKILVSPIVPVLPPLPTDDQHPQRTEVSPMAPVNAIPSINMRHAPMGARLSARRLPFTSNSCLNAVVSDDPPRHIQHRPPVSAIVNSSANVPAHNNAFFGGRGRGADRAPAVTDVPSSCRSSSSAFISRPSLCVDSAVVCLSEVVGVDTTPSAGATAAVTSHASCLHTGNSPSMTLIKEAHSPNVRTSSVATCLPPPARALVPVPVRAGDENQAEDEAMAGSRLGTLGASAGISNLCASLPSLSVSTTAGPSSQRVLAPARTPAPASTSSTCPAAASPGGAGDLAALHEWSAGTLGREESEVLGTLGKLERVVSETAVLEGELRELAQSQCERRARLTRMQAELAELADRFHVLERRQRDAARTKQVFLRELHARPRAPALLTLRTPPNNTSRRTSQAGVASLMAQIGFSVQIASDSDGDSDHENAIGAANHGRDSREGCDDATARPVWSSAHTTHTLLPVETRVQAPLGPPMSLPGHIARRVIVSCRDERVRHLGSLLQAEYDASHRATPNTDSVYTELRRHLQQRAVEGGVSGNQSNQS